MLTSYLVANAIILPVGAWASSHHRSKEFLPAFVSPSLRSPTFFAELHLRCRSLLIARVLQGVGGGGLQLMAQAIMGNSFAPKNRGQAFALYGLVAVLAPSLGPTIGGWITDN